MQFLSVAILSAAGLAAGFAQQPSNQNTANRVGVTRSMTDHEAQFVRQTLESNRREVELAQMALKQAGSQDVKNYAQQLITVHTAEIKRLEQMEKEYGIPDEDFVLSPNSPAYRATQERTSMNKTGIDPKTNQGLGRGSDRLPTLTGSDFDSAFRQQMIEDHEALISKFEAEQKTVANPDLKSFIDTTLPTLKEHLSQARTLKS